QQEEHKFHDLFEFSPDATLMANAAGQIVLANRRAEQLFGYTCDELVQLNVEALLPEDDRERHVALRQAFFASASARTIGTAGTPLRGRRRDGGVFPADLALAPLRSDQGLLMVVVVRDVSERVKIEEERRSLEAQLRHSQKMEAIGTLAGGIAHDFNNLLAAIVSNLELARMDVESEHPAVQSLDAIAVAAERARQLVQQILAFSRRSPPQRSVVSPRTLVDEVVRLLRATVPKGIDIRTEIATDVPQVFVDSTQIHQVLMNLGTNAWHAIERGLGTIAIRLDAVSIEAGDPSHGNLAPGRYARLSVKDDGRGMPAETLERIFEPFFTTKPAGRGSGLGLSVVHGIVTEHGGTVSVTSAPGAGTTVVVCLPESQANRRVTRASVDVSRPATGRVAFVDDELAVTQAARGLLARLGYSSMVYASAAELMDAVQRDPRQFDVIVTDCHMPGMSGLDVAREIARLRADLPVVLISGFSDHKEEDVRAAGIRYRLDKPFSAHELDLILRRAIAHA
ncbi:MAG: ATP-binding protein, partial [Vicinamibacterales bacterium]